MRVMRSMGVWFPRGGTPIRAMVKLFEDLGSSSTGSGRNHHRRQRPGDRRAYCRWLVGALRCGGVNADIVHTYDTHSKGHPRGGETMYR
jgi:hypothetical protein